METFRDKKNNSFLLLDGDTAADTNGNKLRIGNVNAREVDKIIETEGGIEFKQGQIGGEAQAKAIAKVIRDGGFNDIEYTGEYDDYDRQIINLRNDKGESLESKLISSGITEVTPYTSEEAIVAKRERELYEAAFGKEEDPLNDLGDDIRNQIAQSGIVFKDKAINEKYYDPEIHSGVRYRDVERTLDNKAIGFTGNVETAWDQGWDGVKEGLWGYLEGIGQVTDIDMIQNLGEAGVRNARLRMADAPEIILDYQDVDNVWDGFSWAMNNAVMAAPYLVATFGAAAAAVPTTLIAGPAVGGATALAPIATIYAGHTWNEMEGEKGIPQFLAATAAGVAAAMVERLGMKALISPADVLSQKGINRLVSSYAKKNNVSREVAKSVVLKTAKEEQASMARSLLRMRPSDIAKFTGAGVLKAGALGSLKEGGTEIIQDGIQVATAGIMSEKEYTQDELVNRFINAGLAGGVLGSGFSAAGNIYSQGQNQLTRSDLAKASTDRYRIIEQARIRDAQSGDTNLNRPKPSTVTANIDADDRDAERDNYDYDSDINYFSNEAQVHENEKRGIKNFFRNNDELYDYIENITSGFGKLFKAAESSAVDFNKLVQSKIGLDIFSRIGQMTTGVYHAGQNFKQYSDQLISDLKTFVDEKEIAKSFGYKNIDSKNAIDISKKLREFGRSGGFENYELMVLQQQGAFDLADAYIKGNRDQIIVDELNALGLSTDADIRAYYAKAKKFPNGVVPFEALKVDSFTEASKLYAAAKQIKSSYDASHSAFNEEYSKSNKGKTIPYRSDYWWRHQGFDHTKVRKNPAGFKKWLKSVDPSLDVESIYQNIANRGAHGAQGDFSLVGGVKWRPWSFNPASTNITDAKGFNNWSNDNLFESLNKTQNEVAKYNSTTKYFGEGGSKLSRLFKQLETEGVLNKEEIQKFAWYTKAIIDSSHGNFRRIQDPRWAAVNNYLTSWSIFAGLPLSTISSIPETAMVYFKVKDSDEFKQANTRFIQQVAGAWDNALKAEVEITKKQLEQSGLSEDQNTVVDRLATGERDVSFIKAHEAFFRAVGIKQFTQFQRRMNAAFAVDTVKSGFNRLEFAPKNSDGTFNLDRFNEVEMRTFLDLSDLGIDVQKLYDYFSETDEIYRDTLFDITDNRSVEGDTDAFIRSPTQRETATRKLARREKLKGEELLQRAQKIQEEVNEQIQTAIYRFVNERIQNPQAANRPLFFQDPHYQLFTQFNGFISTFTANVIPKLWRDQLAKGNPKVKYDMFALVIMMMALGGASQYIKDLIKFGQSSPYLDEVGYVQRALYSSGVIGQYERVVDMVHPLYPQRGNGLEWMFNTILGEAGPSARNIETVLTATGQALSGETERAVSNFGKILPGIGPVTSLRRSLSDVAHLENPLKGVELPDSDDIIRALLR